MGYPNISNGEQFACGLPSNNQFDWLPAHGAHGSRNALDSSPTRMEGYHALS